MRFVRGVYVCLLLLLVVGAVGNMVPQMQEAKGDPSGQWYMIQMDTRTGYSGYMQDPLPASLYNTVKAWKDAGFSAVVVTDYLLQDVTYYSWPNFDPETGWYNYSVTGMPHLTVANFSTSYPSIGAGAGSGRLYVNGTGKAMVSYYHSTYTAQSGRHTLDLYRTQILDRWYSFTSSFSGNVALGVEIRFTSGRSYIVYRRAGTGDYINTTNTRYLKTLIDWSNRQPLTHTGVWLGYYEDAATVYDNPQFNITETYINLWGLSNYLNDKLFDFRWFVESFDSSSWISIYFDMFYWIANRGWSSYIKDMQLAEFSHGILVIPGYDITTGLPHGQENEGVAVDVNGVINYNGTLPSFLTTPAQVADRGGLAFLDELFFRPDGTAYPDEESVSLVDWLGRGFIGSYIVPNNLVKNWDPALKIIFDEERTERMWIVKGAAIHGNYTQRALRSKYSMVYVEGTLTKQKIVDAIAAGHVQAVLTYQTTNEVVRTNLTIQDFSIGSWIMGDWATPSSSPVLNIDVRCDVPINNVTLYWNGKILKSWFPYTKTFTQSLDVAMSGVFRLVAYDRYQNYMAIGNPIFLKPTIPYVKETTHPRDLAATFFDNKLAFTVSAPSGTTSTTQVYVGDKGEPSSVSGATTWSYNSETKTATINVLHAGPQEIILSWIEHNPPTTAINLDGVQGNNSWFTSNVTVTLNATDDIPGVDRTEYSFDNATWTTYTVPFTVSTEGNTIIYYKSTDKDGNVETIKAEAIKIDKTSPFGSIIINNGFAYSTSAQVTLTLNATDATSGVAQMRFSHDNTTWRPWEPYSISKRWVLTTDDGTKTVYVQFMDDAGLISPIYQDIIVLDTTKPTANAGDDQTVNEDTLVTLDASASQDENGIAIYTWAFTDETPQTLSGKSSTYTFTTPGTYTVTLNVTDAAGNYATDTVIIAVLDVTKPVADAGPSKTLNVGATVTFDAGGSSDNVGVVSYEWDFGDGTTATGKTITHIYTSSGIYTVTLTVKDASGNAATHSITVTVLPAEIEETGEEPFPLWVLGVVVVAIGITVTITVLSRKKEK